MTNYMTHSEGDFAAYGTWEHFMRRISDFTMLRFGPLQSLILLCEDVVKRQVPGDFVEAGVWRGGASFVMAEALRRASDADRRVWMFDSFEGLPAPADVDGSRAQDYVRDVASPWYLDNCRADIGEVLQSAKELGFASRVTIVKGWFDQTLPEWRGRIGDIAMLRIDCDWFESTRCCFDELFDQVSPGGVVIVDDYYYYDGAALAVHEFLGRRGYSYRVESVLSEGHGLAYNECAFIRKTSALDNRGADRLPVSSRFSVRNT
jgi:O-methyltransferase